MGIETINPATEAVIASYELLNDADINACIDVAHARFLSWRQTDLSTRCQYVLDLARQLCEQREYYADLATQEMGKPISASLAEIDKCIVLCQYYAEFAEQFLAPRLIQTNQQKSQVCYQPLGVVFAIMPWNFPFWQVFRFVIPAIMAGNVAILKHASITAGIGIAIAELFLKAGFPEGVFQNLLLDKDGVAQVIANDKIVGVSLTGSDEAGRIIAANAGAHLKKTMLELGGSDPYIVLEDADIELAARCIVDSRLNNCGQVCIAAKRVIVLAEVFDELLNSLMRHMTAYQMGDPSDARTTLGPMARGDLRNTLHQQVLVSLSQGAHLHSGGMIPEGLGFYYPPTLLTNVRPGMSAFDDELFGPVISVITATDEADAIMLANHSRYGLGAAVFTKNLERGERIAIQNIEAGVCFVNAMVVSDPRLPFGGIKQSGFGRELSKEGLLEFVNIKTIVVHES